MKRGRRTKIVWILIIASFFIMLPCMPLYAQDYVNTVDEDDVGIFPTVSDSLPGMICAYYNLPADYWGPNYGRYISISFEEDDDFYQDPLNLFSIHLGYEDLSSGKSSGTIYIYMPVVSGVYTMRAYKANPDPNANLSNLYNNGYTTVYEPFSDVFHYEYYVQEGPASFSGTPSSVEPGEALDVTVGNISSPVSWIGIFPEDAKTFEDCIYAQTTGGQSRVTYDYLPPDIEEGRYCLKVVSYFSGHIKVSASPYFEVTGDGTGALPSENLLPNIDPGLNENIENLLPKKAGTTVFTIGESFMNSNGAKKEIDPGFSTAPVINNGRTFIPVRALIEEMGGTISWDGTEKKLSILLNDRTIDLWIGKNIMSVDGVSQTIDAAPYISKTGRTMLPLRAVAASLNCNVDWDNITKTITISGYTTGAAQDAANAAASTEDKSAIQSGIPETMPAPSISSLQMLKDDDGVPYFRMEVTIPESVLTLDQMRPADGWVEMEAWKKVDGEDWIPDGGGLEAFIQEPVPGKTGAYYITFDTIDDGGLGEILINAKEYAFKTRFYYTYRAGDEYEYVYSNWSNELSGQSESFYQSADE